MLKKNQKSFKSLKDNDLNKKEVLSKKELSVLVGGIAKFGNTTGD